MKYLLTTGQAIVVIIIIFVAMCIDFIVEDSK